MGKPTERGEAVAAGYSTLADENGDDTLTVPEDRSGDNGATDTDAETETGEEAGSSASPPGPADIPSPPVIETADETTAGKETRTP